MLYFLGWVAFLVCVISAVPIASFLERRKDRPRPQPVVEEEVFEEFAEAEPEAESEEEIETELEKRLRRLELVSEGMTQEEMYAHAQATLELASMLRQKNKIEDANSAVEVLVNQPGIGDHYMLHGLIKRMVLLRMLGKDEEIPETEEELRKAHERLQQNEPQALDTLNAELLPEETEAYRSLVGF